MGCAKILLFVFNFIFVILGIVLIVAGVLVTTSEDKDFEVITSDADLGPLTGAGVLTIIIGVIVFIVAFCGCCGAIKESKLLLTIFIVLLLIILVIEIAGAVLGYVYRGKLDTSISNAVMSGLNQFNATKNDKNETTPYTKAWNELQETGKCCGYNNYTDWTDAPNATFAPGRSYPMSCACDSTLENCNDMSIWTQGCKSALLQAILGNLAFSGTACVVILIAEIFGIIFACCVIRDAGKETA